MADSIGAPFSDLFHHALETYGQPARPVGVHSPGHVAATDQEARDEFWPWYLEVIRQVSKTRRFAVPTKESFLREIGPEGASTSGRPRRWRARSRRPCPLSAPTGSISSTEWAA